MSVNYKAIADAVQPGEDFQAAFDRMRAETVTRPVDGAVWMTEISLMSRIGVQQADEILTKIEAAVSPRVQRMIQSDQGVNLADPQTQALLSGLVQAGVLTQAEVDSVNGALQVTEPKWPGLKIGHVANAIEWREQGAI